MQIGDAIMNAIIDFDRAVQAAEQRRAKIRQLRMCASTTRCGNCGNWMKTRSCPREARGTKVSMNALACNVFTPDSHTQRAQVELCALLEQEA